MASSPTKRVAVLASGSGSNFEALVRRAREERWPVAFTLICDRPRAPVIRRANRLGVPAVVLPARRYPSRERYNEDLLVTLRELEPLDLVVLAGYMKILPPSIVRAFSGRMVNIHPSLLPRYPGLHAIRRALEAGETRTGVTVHWVDEGVDTGPIIAQVEVPIDPGDTLETLEARVHAAEHRLYPEVIASLLGIRAAAKGE